MNGYADATQASAGLVVEEPKTRARIRQADIAVERRWMYNSGMFQVVITIALVLNLVACPSRCLPTGTESGCDGSAVMACGDTCCPSTEKGHDIPAVPEHDCACWNCICEGATLASGIELWDADASTVPYACHACTSSPRRTAAAAACFWRQREVPGQTLLSGRAALIAHQIWLI